MNRIKPIAATVVLGCLTSLQAFASDISISSVSSSKGQYKPGESFEFTVRLQNNSVTGIKGVLQTELMYLADTVGSIQTPVEVPPGESTVSFNWNPPRMPDKKPFSKGFGVTTAFLIDGKVASDFETAVDQASNWSLAPRYGFVSDFDPGDANSEYKFETMAARYHINAVQFYDWMYRHDTLIPPQPDFTDSLGRSLSLQTIRSDIKLAHKRGMETMAYSAIYAASPDFHNAHEDWSLFDAPFSPMSFGDGYLYLMNPARNSPWSKHLISELTNCIKQLGFDGIHLDQYGYPKIAFSDVLASVTDTVDVGKAFRDFIEDAKRTLKKVKPTVQIAFNSVNDWPTQLISPSSVDISYIEVWEPNEHLADLRKIVEKARKLGPGKGVVIAGYIDPVNEPAVRLADAAIFASGGTHIEIGEGDRILADPYFPNHKEQPAGLRETLVKYYDFLVRYENVLTVPEVNPVVVKALSPDIKISAVEPGDNIWMINRKSGNRVILNMINTTGLENIYWRKVKKAPKAIDGFHLRIYTSTRFKRIWSASPDGASIAPKALQYTKGHDTSEEYLDIQVPKLEYWRMLVLES